MNFMVFDKSCPVLKIRKLTKNSQDKTLQGKKAEKLYISGKLFNTPTLILTKKTRFEEKMLRVLSRISFCVLERCLLSIVAELNQYLNR